MRKGHKEKESIVRTDTCSGSQQKAFEAVLEAARSIDVSFGDEIAETGTTMTQAVWKMIIEGKFTQHP